MALRKKWSRGQLETHLANVPACLTGMEACVDAHHLSRQFGRLATMSPDAAKVCAPYSKVQKKRLLACRGDRRGGAAPDGAIRGHEDCRTPESAGA
jgi:hypothetical protein